MSNETYAGFISALAIGLFLFFLFYTPYSFMVTIGFLIAAAIGVGAVLAIWFCLTDIISSWFNGDL